MGGETGGAGAPDCTLLLSFMLLAGCAYGASPEGRESAHAGIRTRLSSMRWSVGASRAHFRVRCAAHADDETHKNEKRT